MRVLATWLVALTAASCGARTALDEGTAPRAEGTASDAASADAECPPGEVSCTTGCGGAAAARSCQEGMACAVDPCAAVPDFDAALQGTCVPGEQLCIVGCPERQDFTPPVCQAGPCPINPCLRGADAAGPVSR